MTSVPSTNPPNKLHSKGVDSEAGSLAMNVAASVHLIGLGLHSSTTSRAQEMDGGSPRRSSSDTMYGGSDSWGEFEAFSPVSPRIYRLHGAGSSRSTSPSPLNAGSPNSEDARTLHPLRTSYGHPSGRLSTSPSSAWLSPSSSSESTGQRRRSASPIDPYTLFSRQDARALVDTWVPATFSPKPATTSPSNRSKWSFGSSNNLEHNRNLSLTSACPPATADSPSKHRPSQSSASSSVSISPKQYLKNRNEAKSRWRSFAWGEEPSTSPVQAKKLLMEGSP